MQPAKGTNNKRKTEIAEMFEERLGECVQNYKHIDDVTSPGHTDRELLKKSWEEFRCELNIHFQSCLQLSHWLYFTLTMYDMSC